MSVLVWASIRIRTLLSPTWTPSGENLLPISLVLWILFWHWVADFVCQSNYMAQNKSMNWKVLLDHVVTYSVVLNIGLLAVYRHGEYGLGFSSVVTAHFFCLNAIGHFVTDAITSRITSRLWEAKQVHWFFVVIGIDQFIHYATLLYTAQRLLL